MNDQTLCSHVCRKVIFRLNFNTADRYTFDIVTLTQTVYTNKRTLTHLHFFFDDIRLSVQKLFNSIFLIKHGKQIFIEYSC